MVSRLQGGPNFSVRLFQRERERERERNSHNILLYMLYKMYLKCLDRFQEFPHTKTRKKVQSMCPLRPLVHPTSILRICICGLHLNTWRILHQLKIKTHFTNVLLMRVKTPASPLGTFERMGQSMIRHVHVCTDTGGRHSVHLW
jgi:hypothetical protein